MDPITEERTERSCSVENRTSEEEEGGKRFEMYSTSNGRRVLLIGTCTASLKMCLQNLRPFTVRNPETIAALLYGHDSDHHCPETNFDFMSFMEERGGGADDTSFPELTFTTALVTCATS